MNFYINIVCNWRALLIDTAEEMEMLNSESTRDRKDTARDLLLADMSSSDEGSDNEKVSSSKENNRIAAREELLADDSDKERANISDLDKKGRRELLADNSSDNEENEKIDKVDESNEKNNRTPKKSQRGRQEVLADKSSDDEVSERFESSSRTKKNKNEMRKTSPTADKSGCAKGREALLAGNSFSDVEEKTADNKLETSQCKDKKRTGGFTG